MAILLAEEFVDAALRCPLPAVFFFFFPPRRSPSVLDTKSGAQISRCDEFEKKFFASQRSTWANDSQKFLHALNPVHLCDLRFKRDRYIYNFDSLDEIEIFYSIF